MSCGDPYLTCKHQPSAFCCMSCSQKGKTLSEVTRNKISKSGTGKKRKPGTGVNISKGLRGRKLSNSHKLNISVSKKGVSYSNEAIRNMSGRVGEKSVFWKGGVKQYNLPLYDTYSNQISWAEDTKPIYNGGIKLLGVKCTKCDKWFVPKCSSVKNRVNSIYGISRGENRFYCSEICKNSCNIFNKQPAIAFNLKQKNIESFYTKSELSVWSQEVISRANHKCEICGDKAEHAHHIQPKKLEPFFALDPENGLAVCKNCHNKYGHTGECGTGALASVNCKEEV